MLDGSDGAVKNCGGAAEDIADLRRSHKGNSAFKSKRIRTK